MTQKLREVIKGVCLFLIIVSLPTAVVVWLGFEKPDQLIWWLRISASVLFIAAFAVFLRVHSAREKVPVYLRQYFKSFFDCNGLCFAVSAEAHNGICLLNMYFQNRHSAACRGRIMMRSAEKVFGGEDGLICCDVECPGGAFGVIRIPVPVDRNRQGERHWLDIAANIEFPAGHGKTLWHQDGILIRSGNAIPMRMPKALSVATFVLSPIPLPKPASVGVEIPYGVASELPGDAAPETKILWHPMDPELP